MITDQSTIEDLAAELATVRGMFRIASRRIRGGTRAFTVGVEWPGGNMLLTNVSLSAAIDIALNVVRSYTPAPAAAVPEPIEPAVADPDGAKIGPAPTNGTRVGYLVTAHCASCGFGENEGERYSIEQACPNCGTVGRPCTMPPKHEENHDYEGS